MMSSRKAIGGSFGAICGFRLYGSYFYNSVYDKKRKE